MIIKQGDILHRVDVLEQETILDVIKRKNISFISPCNGNGTCGKCKVNVNGVIKNACQTKACNSDIVQISNDKIEVFTSYFNKSIDIEKQDGVGLSLDLGTTTLVFLFVDLLTGKNLKTVSLLNPQTKFGSDVISRVKYGTKNGVNDLFNSINSLCKTVINDFLFKNSLMKLKKMVVAGNTIMLHTFVNEEISSFGYYPFKPKFLEGKKLSGEELNLNVDEIFLVPSISSFVGGDLSAGILSSDLNLGNNILIDIGTNGEIICSFNKKLVAISVAAGPAFEGANIECGIGGVSGAISHFKMDNKELTFETINHEKPIGICGSGLIDLVSILLDKKIIEQDGYLVSESSKFFIDEKLYISQKDVRNIQLAKSAICAGIRTIISIFNIEVNSINNVFISGGFGNYINLTNAIKIGLLPNELKTKFVALGNSSLLGAKMILLNNKYFNKISKLVKQTETIDLSTNEIFNDLFVENMNF